MEAYKMLALAVTAVLWTFWAVLKLRETDWSLIRGALDGFSRLGWLNRLVVLFFVVQFSMFGGAKHGGTNDTDQIAGGTNDVGQVDGGTAGGETNAPSLFMGFARRPQLGQVHPGTQLDYMADCEVRGWFEDDDFANGFVLSGMGIDEAYDFSAPAEANVATNWMLRGAAKDCIHIKLGIWPFLFRCLAVTNLMAFADGSVRLANEDFLPPFARTQGIAPMARWNELDVTNRPSLFWWSGDEESGWRFTWQNALANRQPTNAVSCQLEMRENGDFICRYGRRALVPRGITSLRFSRITEEDRDGNDRDGDGLSAEDEIFYYGTDPGLFDTDGDAIPDCDEVWTGTNPLLRDSDGDGLFDATDPHPDEADSCADTYGDGFPDVWAEHWFERRPIAADRDPGGDGIDNLTALLMGVNPLVDSADGFAETRVPKPDNLNAWIVVPVSFSFSRPVGLTNLIVRTFTAGRVSPWQQYFVSSCPERAAGWRSSDVVIEWECGEAHGTIPASAHDSFRLPLTDSDLSETITVRVVATGAKPTLTRQLYLLRWTPSVSFSDSRNVSVFEQDRQRVAVRPDADSGAYSLPFQANFDGYPHTGGMDSAVLASLSGSPVDGLRKTNGVFAVDVPTSVYLPPEGVQPEKQLIFYRFQVKTSSTVPSGPRTSRYATPYPLDTRELRKSFYAASKPEMDGTLTVELEPEIPELGYTNLSVQRLRSNRPLLGASLGTPYRPPADMVPTVGDEPCTNNVNHIDPEPDWYDPEPDNVITNNDSCSCRCNLDGTSLGSFRLRISLGEPAKDELSGYLWTVVTRPTQIRASSFNVLGTDNVHAETNDTGTVTIYCSDNGGRTVVVSNMVNGVDIPIWLASGELDSIWQIRNPEGDPSTIRVTRYTHLWNATVDETYAIRHDDAGYIVWEQTDNIRGVRRVRREVCDPFDREFVQLEDVKTYLAGQLVREETQTYDRIGEGGSAVRRLVSAEGYDERGAWFKTCTYYNDAGHPRRHGKLRSVRSDRSSWTYYDYDANGRETVRIEQLDGSRFPVLEAVALRALLPVDVSAKITVSSYSPGSWDDEDRNDFEMPRLTETYVRKNGGSPVMIGRTQRSYTRETDGYGVPLRRIATTEGFGTAVRTTERVEYPDDAEVPACLRGLEVLAENSDGTESETMYDFWGDVIEATTYTWFNGVQRPTYAVTTSDAEFGHILCEETRLSENGETIDWIVNCYDDRQRLRSTTYSDGTYETNVYSCCRLLWKQDREGRKTLRSARTGTDSLYFAEEDVWYGCQSWNGDHRVVQHFFDGFGRETNTVTYSSYYDGEAEDPVVPGVWQKPSYRTTVFLDNGGIGESCTVDERGALTDSWGTSSEASEERHVSTSADDISPEECEITYRGGRTETYRSWDGKWTRQIRETTYSVDGNRVETMTTGSSDYGTVTNSVMVFDPLGRMVSFLTPQGMSTLAYDGSTSRVLSETFVSGDVTRVRAYVYDTYGEEVGETIDGVTSRSDVSYEQIGEVWWKVTRDKVSGPEMQNLTTTCEQMTGLGGGLRARTIKNVRGGEKTTHTVNFNADLGLKTEVTASSVSAPVTSYSYYGIEVQRDSAGVTEYTYLDGFGRPVYSERSDQMSWYPVSYKQYDAQGDLTRVEFYTNYWECISESYAYDQRGNRVMAVNANGDEFLSAYDAHGNLISEDGATYPVRYAYDSQDRRIAMWTNRSGDDWDETRWTYAPATGLLTQKRRADGTTVGYAYTPDGLLETTSCSNGHWTRNVYDSSRQIVGVETNAGDSDEIVRDVFGNETAAQNAVAEYAYALDENGRVTNETVVVGNSVRCLSRAYDRSGRLAGFAVDGNYAAQNLAYREDGHLESVSNAEAIVTYAYAPDGRETGFTLSLANGTTFARTVTRDLFLRELVTDVENSIGEDFTYSYDALRRPIARNGDTFAYDERSQVISESYRATTANCFSYDNIGNATFAALGSATNLYVANAVNEYVAVLSDGCEVATAYDAEGNLTTYGEWTYGYDAQNRLTTIASNGILVTTNSYDYKGRRVRMVTPDSAYTFVYDGWNVVLELEEGNGTTNRMEYYWGKDISGTLQGAGGIGGLLYLKRNGTIFVPIYDAYGNVMEYHAADGLLVASYTYDAFGRTIAQSGSLASTFRHRHATKFYESETGFYYYGYRHYVPALARWLTPDPIEEDGGLNLYAFCGNNALSRWDALGMSFGDWVICTGECVDSFRIDWVQLFVDLGFLRLSPYNYITKTASEAKALGGSTGGNVFKNPKAWTTIYSRNLDRLIRGLKTIGSTEALKAANSLRATYGEPAKAVAKNLNVGRLGILTWLTALEGYYNWAVMIYCGYQCCNE